MTAYKCGGGGGCSGGGGGGKNIVFKCRKCTFIVNRKNVVFRCRECELVVGGCASMTGVGGGTHRWWWLSYQGSNPHHDQCIVWDDTSHTPCLEGVNTRDEENFGKHVGSVEGSGKHVGCVEGGGKGAHEGLGGGWGVGGEE